MKKIIFICALLVFWLPLLQLQAQNSIQVRDVAWSPDGNLLAVAASDGVRMYEISNGTPRLLWQQPTEFSANVLAFSHSGEWVAAGLSGHTGAGSGFVMVWDKTTGTLITSFQGNQFDVFALAFSPDDSYLAAGGGYVPTRGGGDYRVHVWDTGTRVEREDLEINGRGQVDAITYSPDGRFLAFSSYSTAVELLDAQNGTLMTAVHQNSAECVFFDENTTRLVLGFYRSMQDWELRSEPELHLVRQFRWYDPYDENLGEFLLGEFVIGCHLDWFATSTNEGVLAVREIGTGDVAFTHLEEGRRFTTAAFSPDGSRLAFVSDTNESPISHNYQFEFEIGIVEWQENDGPIYLPLN